MLPNIILDTIVEFAASDDLPKLLRLNSAFHRAVSRFRYRKVLILDDEAVRSGDFCQPSSPTILRASQLEEFANCLNQSSVQHLREIVINTHSADTAGPLVALYSKLSRLWVCLERPIAFINYDILALRAAGSFNGFLDLNSQTVAEYEEDCIVTKRQASHKLRNWFMSDIALFLGAGRNSNLERLSFYIEANSYQGDSIVLTNKVCDEYAHTVKNLTGISELLLHSPLSFVRVSEMMSQLKVDQLQLRKLSLTSSHRAMNNAQLNFGSIIRLFNLNELEELELRLSCLSFLECENTCMVGFFQDWRDYNSAQGETAKIRKFCLAHHKYLRDTTQFKTIIEDFGLNGLFPELVELHVNLSNTTKSPDSHLVIDLARVLSQLTFVPKLEVLCLPSFMCEWVPSLGQIFNEPASSFYDILTNRCQCDLCDHARSKFAELAKLDKAKHYSHRVKLSDIKNPFLVETFIDFSRDENVKFLQYVAGALMKKNVILERNLSSSGTMLDMENMRLMLNLEILPFEVLIRHCCLNDLFSLMRTKVSGLRHANFGGVVIKCRDV